MEDALEGPRKELDLQQETQEASAVLQSLGLTAYEARAYIALVAHGYGNAETISETSRIPRTSAYKVLSSLCDKGYAISTRGRPMIFKPEAPEKVKNDVLRRVSSVFEHLQVLHEVLMDKGEPQLVYTIQGKQRVLSKIAELLDTATRTFIISTPTLAEVRETLNKRIEAAVKRGVRATVITGPSQRVLPGAYTVQKPGLIATDIIADGERALIASPDLNVCGYTDNASLAKHLENFLLILMEGQWEP
ncbi:MAG: helix-turn-helix domain-containing protein [Thermoplasmata archaeon]